MESAIKEIERYLLTWKEKMLEGQDIPLGAVDRLLEIIEKDREKR